MTPKDAPAGSTKPAGTGGNTPSEQAEATVALRHHRRDGPDRCGQQHTIAERNGATGHRRLGRASGCARLLQASLPQLIKDQRSVRRERAALTREEQTNRIAARR